MFQYPPSSPQYLRQYKPEQPRKSYWNAAYNSVLRLLWVLVTSSAIWGAISISLGQLQRFNDNPTVITLEKDFRTWLFNLPAITNCDANRVNPTKLPKAISSRWHIEPSDPKYEYYARFVVTVANSTLFSLQGYEEFKDDPSLDVDLYQLVIEVMPDVKTKVTWSHGAAAKWIPVLTEAGACYVINSVAIADVAIVKPSPNETKLLPMTCKYSALSCYVVFEIATTTDFFVHSPYDVVDLAGSNHSIFTSLNRVTELSIMETGCGQGVRELTPQRRGCRFTDEPVRKTQVYSTNACRLSCRSQLAIKLCGCKPFYYIYEEGPLCTPKGMWCLASHSEELRANNGLKCSCSPQCLDASFRELMISDEIWGKGLFSGRGAVRFNVQPPRTRYTREIVFHFQDLVVSFGGAAGLFIGASFISFVEILYFIMQRILGLFVNVKRNTDADKPAQAVPYQPYEAARIMELTAILDNDRRLDQNIDFKF